jgi:hypothetical protein
MRQELSEVDWESKLDIPLHMVIVGAIGRLLGAQYWLPPSLCVYKTCEHIYSTCSKKISSPHGFNSEEALFPSSVQFQWVKNEKAKKGIYNLINISFNKPKYIVQGIQMY